MQTSSPSSRAGLIRNLVENHRIHSQEELLAKMAEQGVNVTQATLSRYLKKLQIYKQTDASGESWYRIPATGVPPVPPGSVADHIVSISFSGQLGVIITHPGCANMVGAVIDGHSHSKLMGTIAGDNTLALLLRQGASIAGIISFLEGIIPGVADKLSNIG